VVWQLEGAKTGTLPQRHLATKASTAKKGEEKPGVKHLVTAIPKSPVTVPR
jgi:hypothetical protein